MEIIYIHSTKISFHCSSDDLQIMKGLQQILGDIRELINISIHGHNRG